MTDIRVGGRYLIDGYLATLIGIVADRQFDEEYAVDDWADFLGMGILVRDDQAGLIHYPDLEDIRIEPL
ncbi:hypothetical protein K7957_06115 [Sphingomonas yunnanensis]|uniref:hypothetical protein n=1 Tax=Sphingomonas yunnanensis TaxID=310400 RepID=UPI001CA630F6|nr:hypothetical protein [Sphingomonas yunnanensis]MBY9062502.1 hypothetical protein [Sphingomonas yunnanensis]